MRQVSDIMLIPSGRDTMHDEGFGFVGGVPCDLSTYNAQTTEPMLPDGQRLSLVLSNSKHRAKVFLERVFMSLDPSHSRWRGTFGRDHRENTSETMLRGEVRDGRRDANVTLERRALSGGDVLPFATREGVSRLTKLFGKFRNDGGGRVPRVRVDEHLAA